MRYSDLIKDRVLDLLTMLDAEGIKTVSVDAISQELEKMGTDADSKTLTSLLDDLSIVNNIKDGIVYFYSSEKDIDSSDPDPEKQQNKIDKLARKQVDKEIKK